jgi:phage/plasmid-associated DNA primase
MSIPIVEADDETKGKWCDAKKVPKKEKTKAEHTEMASFFVSELNAKSVIEDNNKFIWVFQDGYYHPYGESILRTLCANQGFDASKIVKLVRAKASVWRKEFIYDLDPGFTYVNLNNCVRDWKGRRTYEHEYKYNFRYKLPFNYDPDAECPLFDEMVSGMLKNKEDIFELKKWLGYHIMLGTGYQKAAFIVGPPSSSKGTLLKVLTKIVGDGNYSAATLKSLCAGNLYSAADLENKLANICGDLTTNKFTGQELGMYYRITGEDPIQGRVIFHTPKSFRPNAKLTWLFNKLPMLTMGVFNAKEFWRRCLIFETKTYNFYPNPQFEYKLYEELPGIYNHYFEEGVLLLFKHGFKNNIGKDGEYGELSQKWLCNMRLTAEDQDVYVPPPADIILPKERVEEG